MLLYNIITYKNIGEELITFWVIMGRAGSILGQKSALPKLLKNTIVLYQRGSTEALNM
jgi:hypothetical protein